jgi:protein SCO1/2
MRVVLRFTLLACAGVWICGVTDIHAQTTDRLRKELEGIEIIEHLGARLPAGAQFVDEEGRAVRLGDYTGRPMLLTLNYSNCPVLCSLQLAGLAKGLKDLGANAGKDFALVTISIDPEDTPNRLKAAKQVYVRQTGEYTNADRWHFLSGDAEAINAVANTVGFYYKRDSKTGEYRHQATLMVITPDGRVSSYLHGISYDPTDLSSALARASLGEVASADEQESVDAPLLNCYAYDPDNPSPKALTAMRIGGVLTLTGLVLLLMFYFARERARRKTIP